MSTSITISVHRPIRFSQDQSKLEEALLQGSVFEQNLTHDSGNRENLATTAIRQRLGLGVWERDQKDRLEKERCVRVLSIKMVESTKIFPLKFYEPVGLVVLGLKFLNLPCEPKFQFLTTHDPDLTDHTIQTHSLGFQSGESDRFGQVKWLTG